MFWHKVKWHKKQEETRPPHCRHYRRYSLWNLWNWPIVGIKQPLVPLSQNKFVFFLIFCGLRWEYFCDLVVILEYGGMPKKDYSLWTELKWKPEVEYFVVLVGWMGHKVQTENRLVWSVDLWAGFIHFILLCEVCSTDEILSAGCRSSRQVCLISVLGLKNRFCQSSRQSVTVTEETNKLTPPQFQILGRWEAAEF